MNNVEKRIIKQKLIARLALEKTLAHFEQAIIAGGAPRNWYAGKAAKDIDIFLFEEGDKSLDLVVYDLHLNPDDLTLIKGDPPPPEDAPVAKKLFDDTTIAKKDIVYCPDDIVEVWELEIRGERVQWIFLNPMKFEFVKDFIEYSFDFNICKIFFDGQNTELSPECKKDFQNKTLTVSIQSLLASGRVETLSKRSKKMKRIFPDFEINIEE